MFGVSGLGSEKLKKYESGSGFIKNVVPQTATITLHNRPLLEGTTPRFQTWTHSGQGRAPGHTSPTGRPCRWYDGRLVPLSRIDSVQSRLICKPNPDSELGHTLDRVGLSATLLLQGDPVNVMTGGWFHSQGLILFKVV